MIPTDRDTLDGVVRQLDQPFDLVVAKLEAWARQLLTMVPNLVVALLVLLLFWLVSMVVASATRRVVERISDNVALTRLIITLTRFAVLATGVIIALGLLQLDKTLTSLLAGAGVIGLALGFAFQNITANFLSGVFLSVRKPFVVGDIIESNGHFGTVRQINLRTTNLLTPEGQLVLIPNKEIFETPIVNFSTEGLRRIDLPVGISYGDDLEKAKQLVTAALEGLDTREASRPVEVFYTEFGSSSINFTARFWCVFRSQADYLGARSDAIQAIKRTFDENDVTIPFPIRTLDFGIKGGEKLSQMDLRLGDRRTSPAAGDNSSRKEGI